MQEKITKEIAMITRVETLGTQISPLGTYIPLVLPVGIAGIGAYIPPDVWDNKRLLEERLIPSNQALKITPEGITERTGIESRCFAGDETIVGMAAKAAKGALDQAGILPEEIGNWVVTSSTYTQNMPSIAGLVQNAFGVRGAAASDAPVACSGFVYALWQAALFTHLCRVPSIVIASEKYSERLDWTDYKTATLFADGAAAVVVTNQDGPEAGSIGPVCLGNDSTDGKGGWLTSGMLSGNYVNMKGNNIYDFFLKFLPKVTDYVYTSLDGILKEDDIKLHIPHQANRRMIVAAVRKAGIDLRKAVVDGMIHVGNTGAATIPYMLHVLTTGGLDTDHGVQRIDPGDTVSLEAIGASMSWGLLAIKFGEYGLPKSAPKLNPSIFTW